jgi:hypothetical protein
MIMDTNARRQRIVVIIYPLSHITMENERRRI